jgi:hypothetical protein
VGLKERRPGMDAAATAALPTREKTFGGGFEEGCGGQVVSSGWVNVETWGRRLR